VNRRRIILGLVVPAAIIVATVVPIARWGNDLPDRVASHFDISGTPDSSMTPVVFFALIALSLIVPGLVMLVGAALWSGRLSRPVPAFLAGLGGFLAVLGTGICIDTVVSQRGLSDWTEAPNPVLSVLLIVALAVVVGVVAAVVARDLPFDESAGLFPTTVGGETPTMDIIDAERAVFIETIGAPWMMALGGALLGLGAVLAFITQWWIGLILAVSALPVGLLSAFRVQADRNGLSVRSALFGIRFARVAMEEVERASVLHVEPMKWGGWGYRGSLKLAGSAAVVIRRGPGIHLELTNNRSFVVTLDDPRTPAAILNAHAS
jgi:hypothetical protein